MSTSPSTHVVIFRARHRPDSADDYLPTVLHLKELALSAYGCLEFLYATTPDGEEIAITYWPDAASILRWKADESHRAAQRQHARWYTSYRIQVGEIHRDYGRAELPLSN